MGTYQHLVEILGNFQRPVRTELVEQLTSPQRKLIRVMKARTSQLQTFDDEFEELATFARNRAIPNFGRF